VATGACCGRDARVDHPVGSVDLAPTFCAIAGLPVPEWMDGSPLPTSPAEADAQRRERVITEWESVHAQGDIRLRSVFRDGFLCTAYEPGTFYDGSEGELYDVGDDPQQRENLWADPARRALRDDLVADLYASLPAAREPRLDAVAPV
jgi:arylsulfatase A-like enzyme